MQVKYVLGLRQKQPNLLANIIANISIKKLYHTGCHINGKFFFRKQWEAHLTHHFLATYFCPE